MGRSERRVPSPRRSAVAGALAAVLLVGLTASAPVAPPGQETAPVVSSATATAAAGADQGTAASSAGPGTVAAEPSTAALPAAAPRILEVPEIGLRATIEPYTDDDVEAHGGAVKPPSLDTVAWWTGGGWPGSDSADTVYLYGHTWREPAVFNRLKELSAGSRVVLATEAGRLVYVVDRCLTVDKDQLASHPEVTRREPGRLLLIGCYRRTGREWTTTHNLVVTAHAAS